MHLTNAETDLYRVLQVDPVAQPQVITAAYRALARIYHPDQTQSGTDRAMALINRAYGVLSDPERRRAYDRARTSASAPRPAPIQAPPPPPRQPRDGQSAVLGHGRYQGWTLEQLSRHDPDYLRWLARHPSGRQYHAEIERLLARRGAA